MNDEYFWISMEFIYAPIKTAEQSLQEIKAYMWALSDVGAPDEYQEIVKFLFFLTLEHGGVNSSWAV